MIKELNMTEELKENLKKIIFQKGESGTFMLYGKDKKQLSEVALTFAKSINCLNLKNDFCGKCQSCLRIESKTHGDLEIITGENNSKIEEVRKLISKVGTSSYEGGSKIFIIENLEKFKNIALNTLLKTIEEPPKGNYFILLTNSLNILSTIKSRSIIINIPKRTYNELGVTKEVFDFFNGDSEDIFKFKMEIGIDEKILDGKVEINKIGEIGKEFFKTDNFRKKIEFYNCLRYWIKNSQWLEDLDKLFFIEEISSIFSENKDKINEFLSYCAYLKKDKDIEGVKRILKSKNELRLPLNLKSVFIKVFFND
ncbi:MAG: ATPase [Fusobacteriaceae bacterium]